MGVRAERNLEKRHLGVIYRVDVGVLECWNECRDVVLSGLGSTRIVE